MTVLLVDIGGIVELHCLRFLFTINRLNVLLENSSVTNLLEKYK
jgi:hypothetical protein